MRMLAILLVCLQVCFITAQGPVIFNPGIQYIYLYEGFTDLINSGKFQVNAKVHITPLAVSNNVTHRCRLEIPNYTILNHGEHQTYELHYDEMNFNKWLSFDISTQGEVSHVYYEADEEPLVLVLKKIILSTLSSRLVVSQQQIREQRRWGYQTEEIGHAGRHVSIYKAEPESDVITFTKTTTTKTMENAKQKREKIVRLLDAIPHKIEQHESFSSPNAPMPGYNPEGMRLENIHQDVDAQNDFPVMSADSSVSMVLSDVINTDHYDAMLVPDKLLNSTLDIGQIPEPKLSLSSPLVQDAIEGNVSCIAQHEGNGQQHPTPCFPELVTIFSRLPKTDLENIYKQYMSDSHPVKVHQIIVDAFGASATENAWIILNTNIFQRNNISADLILRALVHLIGVQQPLPQTLLQTLTKRASHYQFDDNLETELVRSRMSLILGSLASSQRQYNKTWSQGIIRDMESNLGVHDPFNHKVLQESLPHSDMQQHVNTKSVLILSLGNAGHDSSLPYLYSYLNDTDAHVLLKCAAVEAIGNYNKAEIAEKLLSLALLNEEKNVKLVALEKYRNHPHGGDIQTAWDQQYQNSTSEEHLRVRRSVKKLAERIFKGFHWRLESPTVDWRKAIGGKMLGASFGLVIKNLIDINIEPLSGRAVVDVFDTAYGTVHIGFSGFSMDVFRAELCFKGDIQYDLNILAEYGFEDAMDFKKLYEEVVGNVYTELKKGITSFQQSMTSFQGYKPHEIFKDLILSIENMFSDTTNMKQIAQKLLITTKEYVNLPAVADTIERLVEKVMNIFSDIKNDIMRLYKEVIDAIKVTLPWAWSEIETAFNALGVAMKSLLKEPKGSMQAIKESVTRVSIAVMSIIDVKDKIAAANIFTKENRPYWFDVPEILDDLRNDISAVKEAIVHTIDAIKTIPQENNKAEHYTGVDIGDMYRAALLDILNVLEEEIEGPTEHLKELVQPFMNSDQLITDIVKNVKDSWNILLKGYKEARTQLDLIFGPKFHKEFPRKYLESSSCGDGFWESDGNGAYEHLGVDATHDNMVAGEEVVTPFQGRLYVNSSSQISVLVDGLTDVMLVLQNIKAFDQFYDLQGELVAAGEAIGNLVKRPGCSVPHIHVSMLKLTNEGFTYIDPSRYLERRTMSPPSWKQYCDHYILRFKGKTLSSGSITGGPTLSDESPNLDGLIPDNDDIPTISGELSPMSLSKTSKIFDKITDFTAALGFNITEIKEVFGLKIDDIKLQDVFKILDTLKLTSLKNNLLGVLSTIKDIKENEECTRPDTMDSSQLKAGLARRGKSTEGSRQALIERYLESDPHPCELTLAIGVGEWSTVIDLSVITDVLENSTPIQADVKILNIAQLVAYYHIEVEGNMYKVTLGVTWCSVLIEDCEELVVLLDRAILTLPPCETTSVQAYEENHSILDMQSLKVGELWQMTEELGVIAEETLQQITAELREALQQWVLQQIKAVTDKLFLDEFIRFDMCAKGFTLEFGPYSITLYSTWVIIPVGPIPIPFKFGVGGNFGIDFHCTLCVMSMKATATVTPYIGTSAFAAIGGRLAGFGAELRLTAYILTTRFPTKVEVHFSKFPLDIRSRMDMNLVPLIIELRATLDFKFSIKIFRKRITIHKVLINKRLWHYSSKSINKNIFNINDAEPDNSPPEFKYYSVESDMRRRRRKRNTKLPHHCHVEQLPNRDYTDPAFYIEIAASDDRSPVTLTYTVGSYPGGKNVVASEPLGGFSTLVAEPMMSGHKLHFTVSASNNQGDSSKATCDIPTYDMTPPGGRVTMMASTTSHPSVITVSVMAVEDSEVIDEMIAVGYSRGMHGWQVVDWMDISTSRLSPIDDSDDDPSGLKVLEKFSSPQEGQLLYTPYVKTSHSNAHACAKECLSYDPNKCQSFSYDYGQAGICELHEAVHGHGVEIHKIGAFHYFERIGIGKVSTLEYKYLNLTHGSLLFANAYIRNWLGYTTIMNSKATLVDLTPPFPGLIERAEEDELVTEDCFEFTPKHLHQRCLMQTPLHNYRYIIDGPGSQTLFNGDIPMHDELYSRANKMMAGNWDGFYDNEAGILLYTWSIGQSICADDTHPHRDPHEHLFDVSDWTHLGVAYPLMLEDGPYHLTARALSNIEFGGPMAVSVCHATPYIIDTTPPVIHDIHSITYDEANFSLTAVLNATDASSGIIRTEFGLGYSRRDTDILPYSDVEDEAVINVTHQVPDGIPTWLRVRVSDRAAGHPDKPIIVDFSPPINGTVFDGPLKGRDIDYQYNTDHLCGSWDGFYDAESGIALYQVGLGDEICNDNIHKLVNVSQETNHFCFEGLHLKHQAKYFVKVVAWNGAHIQRSSESCSDGVIIDVTPPIQGWTIDGAPGVPDIEFTSDSATVEATWGGFADMESGIKDQELLIHKTQYENPTETLIHSTTVTDISTLTLRNFHLSHRDIVRSEVRATNNALLQTSASSSGFTVDLTDPQMNFLYDGLDPTVDKQFTHDTQLLSANWDFFDEESGIRNYRLTVYEKHEGQQSVFYPPPLQNSDPWIELAGNVSYWSSGNTLQLEVGATYTVTIGAINGAGLTAVHHSSGVKVDPTPPQLLYVHAGVLSDESEEVIDGVVLHNDPNGIQASWFASDPESGIDDYLVAIGTSPNTDDVRSWQSVSNKKDKYLDGISLDLTDEQTSLPLYYISVKARNNAGLSSPTVTSSPIKVVEGDKEGIVVDGAEEMDIDYQSISNTLTVTFNGFESAMHGIAKYQVAVGSRSKYDDFLTYTTADLITKDTNGIGSAGQAQLLLDLSPGSQYFVSVRALTGANNALDSSSDGITVDTTAPRTLIQSFGESATTSVNDSSASASVLYQKDANSLLGEWSITDDESELESVDIAVGTFPGCQDVGNMSMNIGANVLTSHMIAPALDGISNILTVSSANKAGLVSKCISNSVVVDTSPPIAGQVSCPSFAAATSALVCEWSYFQEAESLIDHYLVGIGSEPGMSDLLNFTKASSDQHSHIFHGLPVQQQDKFYVTVVAVNKVGLANHAASDAIFIDNTPPKGGWVIEMSDIDEIGMHEGIECADEKDYCADQDVMCQRSLSQVIVAWQEFSDDETNIVNYEVGIGSNPGTSDLYAFHKVASLEEQQLTVTGLDLVDVRQVFVTVKGYNEAGLYSTATSNGVYISRISAGVMPLNPAYVFDGLDDEDLDFIKTSQELSAHWDFSGDPCTITQHRISIYRVDGVEILPWQDVPQGHSSSTFDELSLKDGETYYFIVQGTNNLGYTYSVASTGATVQLEPPLPGVVRDGGIPGIDLNYQPSTTSLSGNWDGFGYDKTTNVVIGSHDSEWTIGQHQIISHYEVAAGTDRRFPLTRTNIHPFVNVGLNQTWTFENLDLTAETATYYFTVRAYAINTAMVEVISNGIKVGYGGEIVTIGSIDMPRFVSSVNTIMLSWTGFEFTVPVKYYEIGITTDLNSQPEDCSSLMFRAGGILHYFDNVSSIFDIMSLKNLEKDTGFETSSLNMVNGEEYQVVVMATDESGICALASALFVVDMTVPNSGPISVGMDIGLDVLYSPSSDSLHATWSGFDDPESGIQHHEIGLFRMICSPDGLNIIADEIMYPFEILPNNTDSFDFMDINLEEGTPYSIRLKVQNQALLTVDVTSRPILLDLHNPTPGSVHNGDNFVNEVMYSNITDSLTASMLYLPSSTGSACPYRTYQFSAAHLDWRPLIHGNVRALPDRKLKRTECHDIQVGKSRPSAVCITSEANLPVSRPILNLNFNIGLWTGHKVNMNISYDEEDGLRLQAERRVSVNKMRAGCLQTTTHLLNSEVYQFTIKSEITPYPAVTSVVFWDGPKGLPVDFDEAIFDDSTDIDEMDDMDSLDDSVESSTYNDSFEDDFSDRRGFGFQLHTGRTLDNITSDWLVLWSVRSNNTRYTTFNLGQEFITSWHTYELHADFDEEETDMELDSSTIELYVDGQVRGLLSGAPYIHDEVQVTLLSRLHQDVLPEVQDVFNPPNISANFKSIRFPAAKSEACRYGEVFRGGSQPVVEILAAVGTNKYETDIADFQKVATPCIPCVAPCGLDINNCDPDCDPSKTQIMTFMIEDLNLEPLYYDDDNSSSHDNMTTTLPAPYYVTVKAATGSGRSAIESTQGIYLDTSPPNITSVMYIDVDWDSDEPVVYQGNNHSIVLLWEAQDLESPVLHCDWAIGSILGGEDIQPYTLPSNDGFGENYDLLGLLYDNHTYYASVRCTNQAGLTATFQSEGVTILLRAPDVGDTNSSLPGTEPLGEEAVTTSSQEEMDVEWGQPEDDNVDSIYLGIGTDDSNSDIYPSEQVGLNSSGSVHISDDGLTINDGNDTDDEVRKRRSAGSIPFFMEPGRILQMNIKACNPAHKCGMIPVKQIVISRPEDDVATRDKDNLLTVNINDEILVKTVSGQPSSCNIVGGILTHKDMTANYQSAAAEHFHPYIVDLDDNIHNTDRNLRHRITSMDGPSFYVSTTCDLDGSTLVTVSYNSTEEIDQDVDQKLLGWCPESEMWVDVSRSCNHNNHLIKQNKDQISVEVCSLAQLCSDSAISQQQKQTSDHGLKGPTFFILAAVKNTFINSPPVVTFVGTKHIAKNSGKIRVKLSAYDPDGDDFTLKLSQTVTWNGEAQITDDWLVYKPCANCKFNDTVQFLAEEIRYDGETPLTTSSHVTFSINVENDHPRLLLIMDGTNILSSSFYAQFLIEENRLTNEAYEDLDVLFLSYDLDPDDEVSILFQTPRNGIMLEYRQIKDVEFITTDCLDISNDTWDKVIDGIKSGKSSIKLPVPCNVEEEVFMETTATALTMITYKPQENYHGTDLIKVLSQDNIGDYSDVVTIDLFVLHNPCYHGATCLGPEDDPTCSGINRIHGFANYSCLCPAGYAGALCNEDYDECLSSPCPANYTCIDDFNSYHCICTPGYICEVVQIPTQSSDDWKYAVLGVCLTLALTGFAVAGIWFYKKSATKRYKGQSGYQPGSSSGSMWSLFRSNQVSPAPECEFVNQAFDASAPDIGKLENLPTASDELSGMKQTSTENVAIAEDAEPEEATNIPDKMDSLAETEPLANQKKERTANQRAPWTSVRLNWVSGWRVFPESTGQTDA